MLDQLGLLQAVLGHLGISAEQRQLPRGSLEATTVLWRERVVISADTGHSGLASLSIRRFREVLGMFNYFSIKRHSVLTSLFQHVAYLPPLEEVQPDPFFSRGIDEYGTHSPTVPGIYLENQ